MTKPGANNLPAAAQPPRPFDPMDHMMKLTGKDYLPVAARLAWINAEHGHEFTINTELLKLREWQEEDPKKSKPNQPVMRTVTEALFRATITFANGHFKVAHGSESSKDFGDFIEKAETKAVGRALGYAGYGTLQAPEFDESATIARAEARDKAQDNTYDNTRAVDTAQDLGAVKDKRAARAEKEVQPSTTATTPAPAPAPASTPAPSPAPATTGATSTPSTPSTPAPAPAPQAASDLAALGHDQLKDRLLLLISQSKRNETLEEQVKASVSAANQAGKVKRAGELPTEDLRRLVQAVAELVAAPVQAAA